MAKRPSLSAQPHLYIGDSAGRPLDYGTVYFGEPDKDPEFYPIDIFYDEDLSAQAPQPVRTKGGFMNVNGDMVEVYAAENEYSVKVLDQYGIKVFYAPRTDRVIGAQGLQGDKGEKGERGDSVNVIVANNEKTLSPPNITLTDDGELRVSDDTRNAATRKVGTIEGNLVERGADGYPTNNNAIGVGQTWQDVKASRSEGVTYTNSTGRPIVVSVTTKTISGSVTSLSLLAYVNNILISESRTYSATSSYAVNAVIIVPAGSTYKFEPSAAVSYAITLWSELR